MEVDPPRSGPDRQLGVSVRAGLDADGRILLCVDLEKADADMNETRWVAPLWCLTVGAAMAAEGGVKFVDQSELRGVADIGVNSTGPAFADYDNDGDLDIYVPTESHLPGHDNRLWENDGKGYFTNVAPDRGIDNAGSYSRGASWGDYDNDGDMDLAVANMPPGTSRRSQVPTTVYRNMLKETGKPEFEDVTRLVGVMRAGNEADARVGGMTDTGAGVAWADYDNDGYLDLMWKSADYDVDVALFRNNGDGTFADVTTKAGVSIIETVLEANSQGAPNWTDVDQDGLIDLLITNEGDANVLLRNAGDGTFKDITRSRRPPTGIAFINPGNANGACVGDIDNDGDMDVYLPHADQANRLLLSRLTEDGALSYQDITLTAGTGDPGGARGCAMADFDNDGLLDLYVNNGGLSNVLINDVIKQMPTFVQFYIAWEPAYNKLYLNNGDRTFRDATKDSGAEGLGIGSGVGAADLNGDGYPDLLATNRTYYSDDDLVNILQQSQLFINGGGGNNWIKVALESRKGNRNAYGARVEVVAGDLVQVREHTSAHGYNSSNDPTLIFGLGKRESVDHIRVHWPGGEVQTLAKPRIRRVHRLVQK